MGIEAEMFEIELGGLAWHVDLACRTLSGERDGTRLKGSSLACDES